MSLAYSMLLMENKMNRFRLFISNFFVYGLGGIIGKIIPLIMLPLVTRLMPDTTYFGLNDISTIIISFGSSIAIMGMYDAMFRMFFEREDLFFKKEICSSALFFTVVTSVLVFAVMLLFRNFWAETFLGSKEYARLLDISAISVLVGATNSIVSAPTRINNQRKVYLITNFLSSLISYGISIPLLLNGWYILALPLAAFISALSIELIFFFLNKKWFSIKLINLEYISQMLKLALPLMPNFLIYWIFNSADRLMLAEMLGNQAVGVYAIGAKIGQISQLIYTAFAGGWQYFSFSTMKDQDQVKMTSDIFEYLGSIAFCAGIMMATLCNWFFRILFTGEYQRGAIVAPYLFLSPLLLMLFQIGCNQFLIIKKTWPSLLILSGGAVLNIVLNFIFIPVLGIEGAAVATLAGYAVSDVICVIVLTRMRLLCISLRFRLITLSSAIFLIIWRLVFQHYEVLSVILGACLCCIILFSYRNDVRRLLNRQ